MRSTSRSTPTTSGSLFLQFTSERGCSPLTWCSKASRVSPFTDSAHRRRVFGATLGDTLVSCGSSAPRWHALSGYGRAIGDALRADPYRHPTVEASTARAPCAPSAATLKSRTAAAARIEASSGRKLGARRMARASRDPSRARCSDGLCLEFAGGGASLSGTSGVSPRRPVGSGCRW